MHCWAITIEHRNSPKLNVSSRYACGVLSRGSAGGGATSAAVLCSRADALIPPQRAAIPPMTITLKNLTVDFRLRHSRDS
jgi:hypothetical protein